MFQYIIAAVYLMGIASCMPPQSIHQRSNLGPQELGSNLQSEQDLIQNQNAQYQFSTNIEDNINGLTNQRVEVREGQTVKGMYSYSDGYFKRTINYEADDKGYRVVGEEVEPLAGPVIDVNGEATVDSNAHGTHLQYTVKSVPEENPTKLVPSLRRN